ncbi:Telomere-associated protein RIF1 [Linum perenne]
MSDTSDRMKEITELILSKSKPNKSLGYSSLLHLQEQASEDDSLIRILADSSQALISTILTAIVDDDEEIAVQALKCLGFMTYHPAIVAEIPVDQGSMVLDELAKVVMTTKIKAVCNLCVWCISMQQFDASILAPHFHSVLRAVVHALDNPTGSLSTTFEAVQAVMKLATQLREEMQDSSHIWAPPIYRRLVSVERRERDIAERCLLKTKSILVPASSALSKVLANDVKRNLLTDMKNLLNQGMKIQTMQAWGWFVRLLGCYATKNRDLINDMLKIPQQTFTDHNPQVQIATQVAWEGLVDALINAPLLTCENAEAVEKDAQLGQTSTVSSSQILPSGLLKSIKLIMTPLTGIILSKCDVNVYSACFNTWLYLLHKLDVCINHPSVIELAVAPILESVFKMRPDARTSWLWTMCLELFGDLVLVKSRNLESNVNCESSYDSPVKPPFLHVATSGKGSWDYHPVKWQPWSINQLDFLLRIVSIIISHETIDLEYKQSAFDGARRIFKSIVNRVQLQLMGASIGFSDTMFCLNTILCFMKRTCEAVVSKGSDGDELFLTCLQFVEVLIEELQPTLLGSPLYKVSLDLAFLQNLSSPNGSADGKLLAMSSISYLDKATPLIYLITVSMATMIQATFHEETMKLASARVQQIFKLILRSSDSWETIYVPVCLLHEHMGYGHSGELWIGLAKSFKDCIDDRSILPLMTEGNMEVGYPVLCKLLLCPFISHSRTKSTAKAACVSSQKNTDPVERKLKIEHIAEAWKSLHVTLCTLDCSTINANRLSEELCASLNEFIDKSSCTKVDTINEDLVPLCGNAVTCILQHIEKANSDTNKSKHVANHETLNSINDRLAFSARFLNLSLEKLEQSQLADLSVVSSVFSVLADVASTLHSKQTILLLMETLSSPILKWLSCERLEEESTVDQLSRLWGEILNSLQRSQPPIPFDSSFLKLQEPLLQKTLDYPVPTISEVTISFWNSTYGRQLKLDYPEGLLDLLDRLSRSNRINLGKTSPPFLSKCNSRLSAPSGKCNSVATNNMNSKRAEKTEGQQQHQLWRKPSLKRDRLELTEHQREVRRAQQGRAMDCNGHGPGIRTYTGADFSQGNEDSQESQELRNPESILELLRKN